jgi:hypothetical protein
MVGPRLGSICQMENRSGVKWRTLARSLKLMERLLDESMRPITAAFLAALLTFIFGQFTLLRTRDEERRDKQLEIDRFATEQLQDAAAVFARSISVAVIRQSALASRERREREDVVHESWFQDWGASDRSLEIHAYRVRDPELRRLALLLRDVASNHDAMFNEFTDAESRRNLTQRTDTALAALNARAGEQLQSLHAVID